MAEATYEFESKFNEKYNLITRKIIRQLSQNSRTPISEIAKTLNLSRQAVSKRISRLEKEFNLAYLVELNEDKLGLVNPHLIIVKFKRKPGAKVIKELFERSYIPQIVISTKVVMIWSFMQTRHHGMSMCIGI